LFSRYHNYIGDQIGWDITKKTGKNNITMWEFKRKGLK
jgi:hypothetical protein